MGTCKVWVFMAFSVSNWPKFRFLGSLCIKVPTFFFASPRFFYQKRVVLFLFHTVFGIELLKILHLRKLSAFGFCFHTRKFWGSLHSFACWFMNFHIFLKNIRFFSCIKMWNSFCRCFVACHEPGCRNWRLWEYLHKNYAKIQNWFQNSASFTTMFHSSSVLAKSIISCFSPASGQVKVAPLKSR